MQSNIYAQKENGDLRLIAEIEGLSDPALAVDALLDEMPRLKQRQFIVIDLDNVMVVEAGDEIVQPRREINVTSSNGAVVAAEPDEDEDEDEPEDEEPEAEEEAEEEPAPSKARQAAGRGHKPGAGKAAASRRKPAAKPAAAKNTRSRGRKSTAKTSGKSPFKANPASAE